MTRAEPLTRKRRRRAIAVTAALAATAALTAPVVSGASSAAPAAPSGRAAFAKPPTLTSPALTPATFADPPTSVRPMYRWWMPLTLTDDDVLRAELRDIAASGGGGVEISPFPIPGAGNNSNAFLAQHGWGTPLWAHKLEVITEEAAELGLIVDQNLGPVYPPTVPSLNSFNQPEAEQQIIFAREFNDADTSRTGALPAPTTAPPSVTTALCAPASAGDEVLRVAKLGGLAAGDTVTVGEGTVSEKVVVTGLGDRTESCAELSVSELRRPHDTNEAVLNVAKTTRITTLVAQCTEACEADQDGAVKLETSSVLDVTDQVRGGRLDQSFPVGNGNPWVIIDFRQTASGLVDQSAGYSETQPNYIVDHWSRGGAQIQANYWDENVLTDRVKANLARIGRGAIFEDSLELGETQKWTWNFLSDFKKLRGYDPTLLLPALAGAGIQATHEPAFELAGVGTQLREDYRQTLSDLYTDRYVTTLQRWARSHGLEYRAQPYGTPVASGVAAAATGIPEGESLNFYNPLGAEQSYRVISGGAHYGGRNIVSVECCAVFFGGYRSSLAGPNIGGQYGQGGDGTAVGGKYSQGLLDSIYRAFAGGVNQVVWHGYAYRDAPAGIGTSGRDGGSWPGYHPWDLFGILNVNDEFGPRQASWPDYKPVNESLARTQLVLQQGRATVDLGVYYEDLGLAGASVGTQQPVQHMLSTDSATSKAGYTYDYLAPDFLSNAAVEADGGLFGDKADQKALILNNQTTMSVENAQRLLDLATDGLRLFIVGEAPSATTGAKPGGDDLTDVVAELLDQPTVAQVATEDALPAALAAADVRPAVTPQEPSEALGLVRRQTTGGTYDFVYNRSSQTVEQNLTLTGTGRPFLLNTWTGKIEPVGQYTVGNGTVTVPVRVAANDKVIIALAGTTNAPAPAPAVYATASNGEILADGQTLTMRVHTDGRYITKLSNGATRTTDVAGLPASQPLNDWTLQAQTWTPGDQPWKTVKTEQSEIALTTDDDGALPSWRDIAEPISLSQSSGIGTYTTEFALPAGWKAGTDGAYLDLGKVLDSASVTVNGRSVTVNQSDRGRIDLGKNLRPGDNTITIRVATTMFNAVKKSGDSNYSFADWQKAGLRGPVRITAYRDTAIPITTPTPPPPPAPKKSTASTIKVTPKRFTTNRRARVVVVVRPAKTVDGRARLRVDGRSVRVVTLKNGRATIRLPKLRAGKHRVRAEYLGTGTWKPSKSKPRTVRVIRPKR